MAKSRRTWKRRRCARCRRTKPSNQYRYRDGGKVCRVCVDREPNRPAPKPPRHEADVPLSGARVLRVSALPGAVVLRVGTRVERTKSVALTHGPSIVLPARANRPLREALRRVARGRSARRACPGGDP